MVVRRCLPILILYILQATVISFSHREFLLSRYVYLPPPGFSFTLRTSNENPELEIVNRILVTGGNKGIGLAICKKLLVDYPDVRVLLGCRDEKRGKSAIDNLSSELGYNVVKDRISSLVMDTSSDESVLKAAQELDEEGELLYGIVNNAGIRSEDFKATINTNYFGPRRVCEFFESQLSIGGRVVNIASASGPNFVKSCKEESLQEKLADPLSTTVEDLDEIAASFIDGSAFGDVDKTNSYGLSKALLNAYTVLYAEENPDLIVNSCSPGYILTDLTKGGNAVNPPEMGAECPVHLLMSSEMMDLPAGRYYGSDIQRSPLDRYRAPGDPPFDDDIYE